MNETLTEIENEILFEIFIGGPVTIKGIRNQLKQKTVRITSRIVSPYEERYHDTNLYDSQVMNQSNLDGILRGLENFGLIQVGEKDGKQVFRETQQGADYLEKVVGVLLPGGVDMSYHESQDLDKIASDANIETAHMHRVVFHFPENAQSLDDANKEPSIYEMRPYSTKKFDGQLDFDFH
jgi:predicted transcriptional regulator